MLIGPSLSRITSLCRRMMTSRHFMMHVLGVRDHLRGDVLDGQVSARSAVVALIARMRHGIRIARPVWIPERDDELTGGGSDFASTGNPHTQVCAWDFVSRLISAARRPQRRWGATTGRRPVAAPDDRRPRIGPQVAGEAEQRAEHIVIPVNAPQRHLSLAGGHPWRPAPGQRRSSWDSPTPSRRTHHPPRT